MATQTQSKRKKGAKRVTTKHSIPTSQEAQIGDLDSLLVFAVCYSSFSTISHPTMAVVLNFRRLPTSQPQSNNQQGSSSSTTVAQSAGLSSTSIQTSQSVLRIFASNRSTRSGPDPTQALLRGLDESVIERDASKKPHPRTWSYSQITRHIAAGALLMTISYFTLCRQSQVLISNKDVVDLHHEHSYSDLTVLPIRTYPADEKFLLMDYSPWLGFNNMRYSCTR